MESSKLQRIADKIVQVAKPLRVILFGSQARGTASKESDLDLFVIMEHRGLSNFEASLQLLKAVRQERRGLPVDIVVYSPEETEMRYLGLDPIVKSALDEGLTLYEQPRKQSQAS